MVDLTQIMLRREGYLWFVLLALLIVYAGFVQAETAPAPSLQNRPKSRVMQSGEVATNQLRLTAVSLRNNQLNIDVQDQDLHDILNDIAAQGDIQISHLDGLPKKRLSIRFSKLPVVTGLKRLFRAAEVESYVLVTEAQGDAIRVQRIMFFPPSDGRSQTASHREDSRLPPNNTPEVTSPPPEDREGHADEGGERIAVNEPGAGSESGSVFEDLKANTAARRLLSQLVHPNEQVRERALERLVRLMDSDEKQAELLEFLEPVMENLSSEDRAEREAARQEIRKLLRR